MYKEYMEENSNQFIHFQTDIVDSIWNTIQSDYKGRWTQIKVLHTSGDG